MKLAANKKTENKNMRNEKSFDQQNRLQAWGAKARRIILTFAFAVIVLLIAPGAARAATLSVTNTNDGGAGSLRQAIADAAPGDTITFAPDVRGTITLTSGQLQISKSLTISGPGANVLSVSGNNASRVFLIDNRSTVGISGLTISNGNVNSGGGGILVAVFSTLTLNDCTVSNNTASVGGRGGGITSSQSLLTGSAHHLSGVRAADHHQAGDN